VYQLGNIFRGCLPSSHSHSHSQILTLTVTLRHWIQTWMSYAVIRLSHVIGRHGPTVGMLRASMIVSLLTRSFFIQCFAGAVVESRASTPQAAVVPLDKSAGTDSYCYPVYTSLPVFHGIPFSSYCCSKPDHTHTHTHTQSA
jgi:hypothetical protein